MPVTVQVLFDLLHLRRADGHCLGCQRRIIFHRVDCHNAARFSRRCELCRERYQPLPVCLRVTASAFFALKIPRTLFDTETASLNPSSPALITSSVFCSGPLPSPIASPLPNIFAQHDQVIQRNCSLPAVLPGDFRKIVAAVPKHLDRTVIHRESISGAIPFHRT